MPFLLTALLVPGQNPVWLAKLLWASAFASLNRVDGGCGVLVILVSFRHILTHFLNNFAFFSLILWTAMYLSKVSL